MIYSKEQIKDLIFLKQEGCVDRMCCKEDCQWANESKKNKDHCWFQKQPEWIRIFLYGKEDSIKTMASSTLRKLIFEGKEYT